VALDAQDAIRLLAAGNTSEQHSTNSASSGSIGISFGTNGLMLNVGASGGRGKADGRDVAWTNTHVVAGDTLTLQSGGDTTLKGAVAQGETVKAQVGGHLNLESLQDTSTYDAKQQSLGVSVSIGFGKISGSVSASQSKIKSDYASVAEQTRLAAGDGGFDVAVKGDTDLTGAVIASTQKAIDDRKNTFTTGGELTTRDIQNQASYQASSVSVNLGSAMGFDGKLAPQGTGIGVGKDSDHASSTTQAAISGIAGNKDARTGEAETGIARIFDQAKVQKDIQAQTTITQTVGQLASQAVGDFTGKQAADLRKEGKEDEAKKWDEGGAYRVALHTTLGGLVGGASGALGAGASAAAAPLLNEMQESITKNLKDAGASEAVAKAAGQLLSGATAAGIGALASGGNTAGAAMGLNADANNRQLHPNERNLIAKLAKEKAAANCGGNSVCEAKTSVYWTDVLERVAENLVDDRANKETTQYINTLAQIAKNPATEGGMGGVQGYFDDLVTARSMLAPYAGQTISVNGQVAMANGSAQTYFSATAAQKADYTTNFILGTQAPSSIVPGMEQRDANRLERLATPNGSAQPVGPVEEVVLGGKIANSVISLLGRGWSALEVGLAGRVGTSTSGNISAQQITQEGMVATLNATERSQLSKLGTLSDTGAQGAVREKVTNEYFARNGFTQLEGKCGSNNCFDGVFVKGNTVYVVETKPLQVNGAIKLDNSTGYVQLDKDWIEYSAQRLVDTGDPVKQQTAALILQAQNSLNGKTLVKIVAGVNENGVTLVKLAK
jgi:filamentous hemagglutinin